MKKNIAVCYICLISCSLFTANPAMPPKKLSRYTYLCSICNAPICHFRRHIVRTHMPWYMCPAVACTSCQVADDKSGLRRFHASHSRIEGESQLKAWFLLVNGFLLFISSCLGLGSLDALYALRSIK